MWHRLGWRPSVVASAQRGLASDAMPASHECRSRGRGRCSTSGARTERRAQHFLEKRPLHCRPRGHRPAAHHIVALVNYMGGAAIGARAGDVNVHGFFVGSTHRGGCEGVLAIAHGLCHAKSFAAAGIVAAAIQARRSFIVITAPSVARELPRCHGKVVVSNAHRRRTAAPAHGGKTSSGHWRSNAGFAPTSGGDLSDGDYGLLQDAAEATPAHTGACYVLARVAEGSGHTYELVIASRGPALGETKRGEPATSQGGC
mmetsp:Transcript_20720/g.57897  ORF Transcript_20720/g.57897 Transcript_20720/m.57897 type:complete len:258 (-) Transcript_20720:912-1685(-)